MKLRENSRRERMGYQNSAIQKDLYKQRDWLEDQYLSKKKSSPRIAKECGVVPLTILDWLHRYGIQVRSFQEAIRLAKGKHVFLTERALEFLNGLLLGDGHLENYNRSSSAYDHSSKYQVYPEWLSKQFTSYGIGQIGRIRKRVSYLKGSPKQYTTFYYRSQHYIELKELWAKWYRPAVGEEVRPRKKFIKIIPLDLRLTPFTCRQWYIGDGCLNKTWRYITISTQCFTDGEVGFLIGLLRNFKLRATKTRVGEIRIPARSVKDFLSFIGPCPKEIESCYGYKWAF